MAEITIYGNSYSHLTNTQPRSNLVLVMQVSLFLLLMNDRALWIYSHVIKFSITKMIMKSIHWYYITTKDSPPVLLCHPTSLTRHDIFLVKDSKQPYYSSIP